MQLRQVDWRSFKPRRERRFCVTVGPFPSLVRSSGSCRLPAVCWAPCYTLRLQREADAGLHPPGGPGFPRDPHAQVSGTSVKPLT